MDSLCEVAGAEEGALSAQSTMQQSKRGGGALGGVGIGYCGKRLVVMIPDFAASA